MEHSAWRALASMLLPSQRDPVEEIRARLLLLQLQRELAGGVAVLERGDLLEVVGDDRTDALVLGARGSGKTACAVWLAQHCSQARGVPVDALGWPPKVAGAFGFRSVARLDPACRDRIVLVDEAGLQVSPGKRQAVLAELLALARHRGVGVVWTSQGFGSVHRDILRSEALIVSKRIDPMAARFDREEVADWLSSVVGFQSRDPSLVDGAGGLAYVGGRWLSFRNPLPAGWTEEISRLWR